MSVTPVTPFDPDRCPNCKGYGQVPPLHGDVCRVCGGWGIEIGKR